MDQMQYRKLPHGEEQISILGLGISSIQAADEREIEDTIRYAVECGINFFDMASAEAKPLYVHDGTASDEYTYNGLRFFWNGEVFAFPFSP